MQLNKDITSSHEKTSHLSYPKYRPDIDGLRAVAVLSVVGFHAFPSFVKGGFIGVDIFFVISGFLISTIIFSSLERNVFSFAEFYSRRVRRIFPALLVVLAACLAFGSFALIPDEYKQLGKHVVGGAGFISNFLLWQESGYFDNSAETKLLLHLWSLGIEEQFYILWPLLLWLAWKKHFNFFTITIAVGLISFALNIFLSRGNVVADFYSPQTRFWELLAGSLLAYLTLLHNSSFSVQRTRLKAWLGVITYTKATGNIDATLRDAQSIFAAMLIMVGLLVINNERHFPGFWAVLPVLGAVLIIGAGARAWFNRVILSNQVLVWFGLISFPLYLWHWPLLSFARIVEGEIPSISIRIALILISIMLAWLTYRLIEKPLRFGRGIKLKTIALITLMVIVGYAGYSAVKRDGFTSYNQAFSKIANAAGEWHYPGNMMPFQYKDRTFLAQPSLNGKATLFVGDSNIEQYYVRTDELIKLSPETINGVIFSANVGRCLPIPNTITDGHKHCDGLMEKSFHLAISRNDISTVVLGGQWYGYLKGRSNSNFISNGTSFPIVEGSEGYELALEAMSVWIRTLKNNKKMVYLVLNIPIGDKLDPKYMAKRSLREFPHMMSMRTGGLDYRAFKDEYGRIKRDLIKVAQDSGAIVIDPEEFLCSSDTCKSIDSNGDPLYKDSSHLRPSYVRKHAKFIDKTLS